MYPVGTGSAARFSSCPYYAGLKARTTRMGGYTNCGIALAIAGLADFPREIWPSISIGGDHSSLWPDSILCVWLTWTAGCAPDKLRRVVVVALENVSANLVAGSFVVSGERDVIRRCSCRQWHLPAGCCHLQAEDREVRRWDGLIKRGLGLGGVAEGSG